MKNILNFRKAYVKKRVIFLLAFLTFLTISQFPYLKEALNVGNYSKSPQVFTYKELEKALELNGSAKVSTDFLEKTGIYLGLDDESVIEYTYSYTSFDKHFLIIAQEGSKEQQLRFENGPREFVIRLGEQDKHFDAHSLVITEFANLLEVPRNTIDSEFYPHTLILSTMRPHLQFSLYGMILVSLIILVFIYKMYSQVTKGILSSPNQIYLDAIVSNMDSQISNTQNILIIKDFLIYKPTLNFMKQSIVLEDIAVLGIKRWFHKFYVVLCIDACVQPLNMTLKKSEIFVLLETLKMQDIEFIRDDKFAIIDQWKLDPYKK